MIRSNREAARYDAEVKIQFGRAEFIGDTEGTGSGRVQRDRRREVCESGGNEPLVQASAENWSGVRDRWGAAAGEVAPQDFRRAAGSA
jgi:hypothetical protein